MGNCNICSERTTVSAPSRGMRAGAPGGKAITSKKQMIEMHKMHNRVCLCSSGHKMNIINHIPYPGAVGTDCDDCQRPINISDGFHNCTPCNADLCAFCANKKLLPA